MSAGSDILGQSLCSWIVVGVVKRAERWCWCCPAEVLARARTGGLQMEMETETETQTQLAKIGGSLRQPTNLPSYHPPSRLPPAAFDLLLSPSQCAISTR